MGPGPTACRLTAVDPSGIYQLFFELRLVAGNALRGNDDEQLRRVFGFAAWYFSQPAKDL
jgi:hypothetical protein